jgi:hypothetical protein
LEERLVVGPVHGDPFDELPEGASTKSPVLSSTTPAIVKKISEKAESSDDWQRICFYITPIGSEDSNERKHSDLFMSSLVQQKSPIKRGRHWMIPKVWEIQ